MPQGKEKRTDYRFPCLVIARARTGSREGSISSPTSCNRTCCPKTMAFSRVLRKSGCLRSVTASLSPSKFLIHYGNEIQYTQCRFSREHPMTDTRKNSNTIHKNQADFTCHVHNNLWHMGESLHNTTSIANRRDSPLLSAWRSK